jgi:TolB-like protein
LSLQPSFHQVVILSNRFQFAAFEVVPSLRQLLQSGVPVPLGARAFDLLMCLIAQREHLVSRDELIEQVWPGLVVTDANLNVQVSALRKLLGPQAVLTVAGRGYRFGLTVRDLSGDQPQGKQEAAVGDLTQESRNVARERRVPMPSPSAKPQAAAALALPDQPSIAVLPFANFSDEPEQGYFTDGLTEDIITELSRFSELFVIARNSAFTYKGRAVDVRQVSRELGVRYVLEGSVRHTNQRIRVTAQLIDALTGGHLWVEKYDRVLADIFDLQEEVAQAIVAAIAPQIQALQARSARTYKPANLSAYNLAMQSSHIQRAGGMAPSARAPRDEAQALARQALALDPHSAQAWRALAGAQWLNLYFNTVGPGPNALADVLTEGMDATTRAIALDASDSFAHTLKGLLLFLCNRAQEGLVALRQAHALNPNDAYTLAWLGFYEATSGNPTVAEAYGQKALRLSPLDPMRPAFLVALSGSYFTLGDYAKGLAYARQSLLEAPKSPSPLVAIMINLVGLGDIQQARANFAAAQSMAPELVAARLAGKWPSPGSVYYQRAHTFFRVAAGLDKPSAAKPLR